MSGLYGIEFTQFLIGGLPRITDIVVGTRGNNNYQFNAQGIADANGNPIVLFAQAGATALNINQITITNAITGTAPTIAPTGTDTSINLEIAGFGPNGVVHFTGTTNIIIPAGTAGQAIPSQAGGIRANTTSQYLDYWSTVSNSWVDLTTGSAASNLTYVTNTDETAFAPNSQPLSLLATGIMKVTTTTGIVSSLAIPLVVADGGTGISTTTAYGLITGGTVATGLFQNAGTGTMGQVYVSGGNAALGTWTTLSGIAVTSITGTANEITASASTGAVTLSIPSTFIAPGTIQATTSSAAASFLLNGATDGVISILPQAHAGTYNFNLPTTAGTSGYVLTSAGGVASPMTWTDLGGATVTSIAGTANQITASASTGAVTLSIPSTFIAPGTIQATTSSAAVSFLVNGSTDGVITIKGQAHAGTYEFDLPTTAGTSGYVLTSAGGAGSPMTWTNPSSIGGVNSVSGTTNRITASPTTGAVVVDIAATYVGQTSITTLGTITTGVWTGTAISETYGGTNQTSYTAGDILYASASNTLSKLATANSAMLLTNSTGVPAWSGTMTNGQLIIGSTGATPTAATLTQGANVTITNGAASITIATSAGSTASAWTRYYTSGGGVTNVSSHNVSSITYNGPGDVTINFTGSFSSATSYGWTAAGVYDNGTSSPIVTSQFPSNSGGTDPTASACRMLSLISVLSGSAGSTDLQSGFGAAFFGT